MTVRYLIYCDESDDKGEFYSNFYGGAILLASRRESISNELETIKSTYNLRGEVKWTKISEYNEVAYRHFVDKIFDLVLTGDLKLRIMFTQNINQVRHLDYDPDDRYFKLYYQFIKHAFGLRFCNDDPEEDVAISVLLDDAPDTKEKLNLFKSYLASLSVWPPMNQRNVRIPKDDIAEINSAEHVILQAVDVVLGAMQFKLNDHHKSKPVGAARRGKRTRAKERVYKHINQRIRQIYPNFNVGASTGQWEGKHVRWSHPYRHWCFVPSYSVQDRSRGKKAKE